MNNVVSEKELEQFGIQNPILQCVFQRFEHDSPEIRVDQNVAQIPEMEMGKLAALLTELNKPIEMFLHTDGMLHFKVKNNLTK